MPRAGPLRYWSLTVVGVVLILASLGIVGWGTYHLIDTGSCGTLTTEPCSSETGQHIMAVVVGPFVGGLGAMLLVFRGGTSRFRRDRRVADMVARGEMPAPVVKRPTAPPPPPPPDPPTTWRPPT